MLSPDPYINFRDIKGCVILKLNDSFLKIQQELFFSKIFSDGIKGKRKEESIYVHLWKHCFSGYPDNNK